MSKKDKENNEKTNQQDILDLFQESLVDVLQFSHKDLLEDLNEDIIENMIEDARFKKELENLFYSNLEKVTHKKFILGKGTHAPSVRNWIRDFIKVNGTAMFNNLTISNYVTNGDNGKRLDPEEKKIVQKLLATYRNIKFFPQSLKDVPVADWEVIPVDWETSLNKARVVSGPPKTVEEKNVEQLKKEEEKYDEGGLEHMVIEEEIGHREKIESLEIEAKKYGEGSLEKNAINEEIVRLEGSQK